MKNQPIRSKGITTLVNKAFLCLLLFSLFTSCRRGSPDAYSVLSGPFRQTITETGELVAINASSVMMPRINYIYGYNFKVIGLEVHGKNVQKGDSIIKIDPSSIYKYIIEKEESLENELATANKLKVQIENDLQDLKAKMKNEQAAFDLKKLEIVRFKFESEYKRRIKELEFQQAELRLKKVKKNLVLKPTIDKLDQRIQEIRVIQRKSELQAAMETLKQLLIRSPIDGLFQISMNRRTGQTIRLGDEVYLGSMLASIPDLRSMKVMTFVNETDIRKVYPGMKVIVRLDALPSVPFHGEISEVARICTVRDEQKVFKIQVIISESDLRLKPGMTVSCEYVCYESEDDLFVPNICLNTENKHYYVFLKKRGSIQKVEVEKGSSNNFYTVVRGDIKSGQRLELSEKVLPNINN